MQISPRHVATSNLQQHSPSPSYDSMHADAPAPPPSASPPSSSPAAAVVPAPAHSIEPFSTSSQPISLILKGGAQNDAADGSREEAEGKKEHHFSSSSSSSPPPSASAAAPPHSLGPISASFQPFSLPSKRGAQNTSTDERKEEEEEEKQHHPLIIPHPDPDSQKKNSKKNSENFFFQKMFEKAFSSSSTISSSSTASASSSSPIPSPSTPFSPHLSFSDSSACHCLVVEESRLESGSEDWKAYRLALALERDPLRQHLAKWLNIPVTDMPIAYVPKQLGQRLHINFRSFHLLGQALLAHPFLVRCGSTGSAWSKPCGDVKKQALPELLQLSCVPSNPAEKEKLLPDVTQLLAEMKLLHTSFWFPSAASRTAAGGQESRVVFYVLPRNLAQLKEEIDRLHLKHELWGSRVRVHGMNDPALKRCNQCDNLGHQPEACLKYSGLALRLIGKKPFPYSLMVDLQARAAARTAFLGSSFDEMQPSRRLTLLFDMPAGKEEERMTQLATHLLPLFAELHPLLHGKVQCVDIKDRNRECKECGSLARPHDCPFMDPTRARRAQAPSRPGLAAGSPQAAAAADGEGAAARPSAEEMCGSWRRTRTCERKEKGIPCRYGHPEEYVLKAKECFAFQRDGFCSNGSSCQYKHVQRRKEAEVSPPHLKQNKRSLPVGRTSSSSAIPATPHVPDSSHGADEAAARTSAPPSSPRAVHRSSAPPAGSPGAKKKRGRAESSERESDPAAAASASTHDATLVEERASTSSKTTSSRASSAKKQKPALPFGIPAHKTAWADAEGSDEDDSEHGAARASQSPLRTSSLSSISSPPSGKGASGAAAAAAASSRSVISTRAPGRPKLSTSQPALPSRSSSTARGLLQ